MANPLLLQRRAGVVLHPTSLPGPHGSGDFGPNAFHFVDWLQSAGQTLWQTLPLGPVGPGDSPYMGSSAFAGNPLLVALEPLLQRGWLVPDSLQAQWNDERVDYAVLTPWRLQKLREAFAGFQQHATAQDRAELATWVASQQGWLDDYSLFMALNQAHAPRLWPEWPAALAQRDAVALAQARTQHAQEIAFWCFVQWQFDVQWQALKAYAHARQVLLVGDLPIFIAHHSADCWARPELYLLDPRGEPAVVAGVPPDYFSATGQRWGNPLYDWDAMRADGYRWWVARLRRQLKLADLVRIDHFRGFADYWEIPASEPTAIHGRWQQGPGAELFDALSQALGDLPIIAEDLGTAPHGFTHAIAQRQMPGMRVLWFERAADGGFIGAADYPALSVAMTGNHAENPTLDLPCEVVFAAGQRQVEVIGPMLEDEAAAVHVGAWG